MVVQRPLGDPGTLDDLLDGRRCKASLGEQLAGRCDQELAGVLRLAGPQRVLDNHARILETDRQSVTDRRSAKEEFSDQDDDDTTCLS